MSEQSGKEKNRQKRPVCHFKGWTTALSPGVESPLWDPSQSQPWILGSIQSTWGHPGRWQIIHSTGWTARHTYMQSISRDQIANIHWIIEKAREFQKNIFRFTDYAKALTVWITTNCGDNRMRHRKQWPGKQWSGFLSFMTLQSHLNFPVSVSPLYKDNLNLYNLKSPQTMLSFCLWVNFQIQSKLFLYLHKKRYTFHLKVVIKKILQ